MRDALTDFNTAVASGKDDFVSDCDDYDLAKGPVCQKHAGGRNTFIPLEELSEEQVHPNFFIMHSSGWGVEGEADEGNWTGDQEEELDSLYLADSEEDPFLDLSKKYDSVDSYLLGETQPAYCGQTRRTIVTQKKTSCFKICNRKRNSGQKSTQWWEQLANERRLNKAFLRKMLLTSS